MKILVNTIATKKHAGGVFQISNNYILKTLEHLEIDWFYITSEDVDEAVGESFASIRGTKYFVFPTQPDYLHTLSKVRREIHNLENRIKPDLIYSVAAQSFIKFKTVEVTRLTNPWVTHPNKYAWSTLAIKEKVIYYLHSLVRKRTIKKHKYFITQSETCAKGIRNIVGVPDKNVKVVSNVLPAVFNTMDNTPVIEDAFINVACVGNSTPHKNFDIIPDVIKELVSTGYTNIRFHTTLPETSAVWSVVQQKLEKYNLIGYVVNHGRISQTELGQMYQRCQLCFLPTLLEVFSASTVEAMFFQLPIVATDFEFNTEVLADSCLYYKPKNAKDAALQLKKIISDKSLQEDLKGKMKKRLTIYGDYDSHFNSIEDFLVNVVKGNI